jgi:methanogenic corrinoid protein MtbC1
MRRVALTQFKFDPPNTPPSTPWTSEFQDAKLNIELGTSPRLVGGTTFSNKTAIDQNQVKLLIQAAVHSIEETRKLLMKWRRQGQSLSDIYLHGITDSAKLIGQLWSADALDFVNVTIALSRLHQIMEELSPEFLAEGNPGSKELSLLLMTEPGSQHSLGIFMLSEFFRQAGWRVTLAIPQDMADFKRILLSDWFDAAVLSVSTDRHIDSVSKAVAELRKATANPQLKLYVGGPMAHISPELLNWPGTVLLYTDALQTVRLVTQALEVFKNDPVQISRKARSRSCLEELGQFNTM